MRCRDTAQKPLSRHPQALYPLHPHLLAPSGIAISPRVFFHTARPGAIGRGLMRPLRESLQACGQSWTRTGVRPLNLWARSELPEFPPVIRNTQEGTPNMPRQSVFGASESGSRLAELRAIRAVLARAMDNPRTLPRELGPISRQQMELSRQIALLEAVQPEEESSADEQGDGGAAF